MALVDRISYGADDGYVYRYLVDDATGEIIDKLKLIPANKEEEANRLASYKKYLAGENPCVLREYPTVVSNVPLETYKGNFERVSDSGFEAFKNLSLLKNSGQEKSVYSPKGYSDNVQASQFCGKLKITPLGHSRYCTEVVNVETDEVLLKKHTPGGIGLFPQGCNAVIREVMFSREILQNGAELIYVKTPDGITYFKKILTSKEKLLGDNYGARKGTGKGRGRTRGKKIKYEINAEEVNKLIKSIGYANTGFLLQIQQFSRSDSGLICNRGKALTLESICNATEQKQGTVTKRIAELIKAGAITKKPDGYYVNRRFISKT